MLIGISGKMSAGKDTTADVLVNRFGFIRRSMAAALREECFLALNELQAPAGVPEDLVRIIEQEGWHPGAVHAKPTPPSIRRLLQAWGTEFRRAQDTEYWIKRMRDWLLRNTGNSIVIPDIRFPNEADLVREFGGFVWIVRRVNADATRDPAAHSHISERFCDEYRNWDAELSNDGCIADLHETVAKLMPCFRELERLNGEFTTTGSPMEQFGRTLGSVDWHREIREITKEKEWQTQTTTT